MTTATSTSTSTSTPTGRALDPTPFTPITAPTGILVDLFPALVTLPSPTAEEDPNDELATSLSRTRTVITAAADDPTTPDHLYVFTDSAVGPALVYSASVDSRDGSNREGSITTPEGATITFTKESGCGCGSALKSFAPFTHPYSVA